MRARGADLRRGEGSGNDPPSTGAPVGPPHATMLVYLFTDVAAETRSCERCWRPAVERSFNSISIDGDTSTNDTVLLLASGASGVKLDERVMRRFECLELVCGSLAHQIVDDGEGVTHVVTLHVAGARPKRRRSRWRRRSRIPRCARQLGLVRIRTGDDCWQRLDRVAWSSMPALVTVSIGAQPVFELGMRSPAFDEAAAHAVMRNASTRSRWTLEWVRRSVAL